MTHWEKAPKALATTLFRLAHAFNATDKIRKEIRIASNIISKSNEKDDFWSKFFSELTKDFNQMIETSGDFIVAEVTVALPLDEEDKKQIEKALCVFFDKEVEVDEIVDPGIIGGVIVKMQDKIIDNSIAKRLSLFGDAIAGRKG